MTWAIQIGAVFGIPIRLHLTFLLLMLWLTWSGVSSGNMTLPLMAAGLFTCVVLHELGHSRVAQHYGVKVRDITLLPIGGVARMQTIPRNPREEFCIAIAGPAVNFVLAPLLYGCHLLFEPGVEIMAELHRPGGLFGKLALLNVTLGGFNLIPAFPLDGGRILRSFLATRMPHERATRLAAGVGQLFAFALGFVGLSTGNLAYTLIAIFIFLGASEESSRAQTQTFVEGVPVRAAMMTDFQTLRRGDTLDRAVQLLLAGTQHDFPVMAAEGSGEMVGILNRRVLLEALAQGGAGRYVSEVMQPVSEPVSPEALLPDVLDRMLAEGEVALPVGTPERLEGLLTTENLTEYVLIQAALRHRP